MKPEISICISTWCRKDMLEKIIIKLENQTLTRDKYEIIVCDSYSNDGTNELMEKLLIKYNNLKYINDHKNVLATKRNIGIDLAEGNIVVFMDDDVLPENNFIEAHLNAHAYKKNVVFCGNIRFPLEWVKNSNYYRYRDKYHKNLKGEELKFNRIVVMNMSFKKDEFLKKVGYVSEKFIGYGGEDTELGWRISKSGLKIYFLEEALGWHYEKSPTIKQYGDKIYKSGKDGLKTLLELDKNIIKNTNMKYFIYKKSLKAKIYNILINKYFAMIIEKFLISTDSNKTLYIPIFYRYYLAYRLKQGIKDQSQKKITIEDVKDGWDI